MVDLDGSLQPIEIADTDPPDINTTINADFPIFHKLNFVSVTIIFIFVSILAFTFFLPRHITLTTTPQKRQFRNPTILSYDVTIDNFLPQVGYFLLTATIPSLRNRTPFSFTASISASTFRNGVPLHRTNSSRPDAASAKGLIPLVFTDIIDFDSVSVSLNLSLDLPNDDIFFEMETKNGFSSFIISFLRIIFCVILLPSIFTQLWKLNRGEPFTFEQGMTFVLLILSFFEIDPLSFLQLFDASPILRLIQSLLRDVFYAYLGLYCLGLLCYFTREADEQRYVGLVFPYLLMNLGLLILMTQEEYRSGQLILWPENPLGYPARYLLFFAVLLLAFLGKAGMVLRVVTIQKNRRLFYVVGNLGFLMAVAVWMTVRYYVEWGKRSPFVEIVLPMLVLAFALGFDFGHTVAEEPERVGYITQKDEGESEGGIGVEQDERMTVGVEQPDEAV